MSRYDVIDKRETDRPDAGNCGLLLGGGARFAQALAFPAFDWLPKGRVRDRRILARLADRRLLFVEIPRHVPMEECLEIIAGEAARARDWNNRFEERLRAKAKVPVKLLQLADLPEFDVTTAWNVRAVALEIELERSAGENLQARVAKRVELLSTELARQCELVVADMPAEIRALVRERGVLSLAEHNWLVGKGDARSMRNRLQAVKTWPLLLPPLADGSAQLDCEGITAAIDEGRRLVPALALALGVGRSAVQFLQGLTARDVGSKWAAEVRTLARIAHHLVPERRPRTLGEWASLRATVAAIQAITRTPIGPTVLGWLGELSRRNRLGSSLSPTDEDELRQSVGAIENLREGMVRGLTWYLRRRGVSRALAARTATTVADQAIGAMGFARATELAAGPWRRAFGTANQACAARQAFLNSQWLPLLKEPYIAGEAEIVELSTVQAIAEEGRAMRSCVGEPGYAAACLNGAAHIVSVRSRGREWCSTAELHIQRNSRDGRPVVRCVQHKGRANGVPRNEAAAALREFLAWINSVGIALVREYLAAAAEMYRGTRAQREETLAAMPFCLALREVLGERRFNALLKRCAEHAGIAWRDGDIGDRMLFSGIGQ